MGKNAELIFLGIFMNCSVLLKNYHVFHLLSSPGILDVLLAVVAKSLVVQVKIKGKTGSGTVCKDTNTVVLATSIQAKDYVGPRWWLKGSVNRKLSEHIVHLLKDMASVSPPIILKKKLFLLLH